MQTALLQTRGKDRVAIGWRI